MGQKVSRNTNYSIYGQTFFGYYSAIFWPIGLKFFVGTQETIIYRLLVRSQQQLQSECMEFVTLAFSSSFFQKGFRDNFFII